MISFAIEPRFLYIFIPMSSMRFISHLVAGVLALPFFCQAQQQETAVRTYPIDGMITGEQLWETTNEQFEQTYRQAGLQWLSQNKDQARFFGNYSLWNDGIKVTEALAEFSDAKLARINMSIFNRGDSAAVAENRDTFEKQVEDIKTVLSAQLGVSPVERGKDNQSAVKAMGWMWIKPPTAYLLEYSYQKEMRTRGIDFRPEFIRLRVAPAPKPQSLLATPASGANQPVSRSSLSGNLTREANGDVVLKQVPMVDQGPKGYCVVATAERVFRYYGIAVDQHEIAQMANTSSDGGTTPDAMFAALKKLEARMRVRVRALEELNIKDFLEMINNYNREAKRQGKREVDISGSQMLDVGEIYATMDPTSLKDSRTTKNKSAYGKFQRSVADMLEKGVPVMWTVQLGLFPEAEIPQAHGGHMRLIIGYNAKTNEILYSDSWGAEHALKRMPIDNAYAMTTGLYYMEPMK